MSSESSYGESFFFFWKNRSPFSNWFMRDFRMDGILFNCAEQAMMYEKAMLFNDQERAMMILMEKFPSKQKALGRQVVGFDNEVWVSNREPIVKRILHEKFSQNEDLLVELLKTEGRTLVEASPVDNIWGIGLAEDDDRARDRSNWLGLNLLGKLLTEVRSGFMMDYMTDNDISPEDRARKVFEKYRKKNELTK
jgi:ribA/ribD-fused uncharacterized protein